MIGFVIIIATLLICDELSNIKNELKKISDNLNKK